MLWHSETAFSNWTLLEANTPNAIGPDHIKSVSSDSNRADLFVVAHR
jgi:hypothetical protein